MMTIQGFIGSGRVRENLNKPLLWKYVLVSKNNHFYSLTSHEKKRKSKNTFYPYPAKSNQNLNGCPLPSAPLIGN